MKKPPSLSLLGSERPEITSFKSLTSQEAETLLESLRTEWDSLYGSYWLHARDTIDLLVKTIPARKGFLNLRLTEIDTFLELEFDIDDMHFTVRPEISPGLLKLTSKPAYFSVDSRQIGVAHAAWVETPEEQVKLILEGIQELLDKVRKAYKKNSLDYQKELAKIQAGQEALSQVDLS